MAQQRRRRVHSSTRSRRVPSRRAGLVLGALAGAMTLVGGVLYLADTGGSDTTRGIRPLVAVNATGSLESILHTTEPIEAGRWKAIVIHDSGELVGTPARLDEAARRNGLRGLGYHFVIGNGDGMADGELYVGQRWLQQTAGAHAAGDNAEWFNQRAMGICLIGDGNRERFTSAQIKRLSEVTRLLCARLGIPPDRVYLHSQIAPTSSPGKLFPEVALRTQLTAGPVGP